MSALKNTVLTLVRAFVDAGERRSDLANLRFPLFTRDDRSNRSPREAPRHDDHLPPPC